ncbi:MAG: glycosyltransferase family 1 protein, partial [Gorillibacterium sp.]|nr:glycosyltransferase family 1 protein [Gorillibacterium sp.]
MAQKAQAAEAGLLRVLHIVVNMNRGGAETLLMNLYRNTDRRIVQFDFLTCKEGVFDDEIRELGGRIHRIPYVSEAGHSGYVKALQAFYATHPEYKVVHSHLDKMSGLPLSVAHKFEIPVRIAHSHNTQSEGGTLARLYKWIVGTRITPHATHMLACSQAAAKWLFTSKSEQAVILPNGIDVEQFTYRADIRREVRSELGLPEGTFVIGHVGRFAQQKNHGFLLELFSRFHDQVADSVLVLVGVGPLQEEMQKRVEASGLADHVRFLGARSDVARLLQGMDTFVFPSLHEGLGIVIIEAQAAGLPCLISDSIPQEADLGFGFVEALPLTTSAKWMEKLILLVTEDRSRIVSAGDIADKGYDIKQTAKQIQDFYVTVSVGGAKDEKTDRIHS